MSNPRFGPRIKTEAQRRVVTVDAEVLARAITLFNEKPRFGPRNRRLRFDSYSVAGDLSEVLRRHGWNPQDPVLFEEE